MQTEIFGALGFVSMCLITVLIALLPLIVIGFFIMKYLKSKSERGNARQALERKGFSKELPKELFNPLFREKWSGQIDGKTVEVLIKDEAIFSSLKPQQIRHVRSSRSLRAMVYAISVQVNSKDKSFGIRIPDPSEDITIETTFTTSAGTTYKIISEYGINTRTVLNHFTTTIDSLSAVPKGFFISPPLVSILLGGGVLKITLDMESNDLQMETALRLAIDLAAYFDVSS